MPTCIALLNFTRKGAERIRDGPKRVDAAKQAFRAAGAELKGFYVTMGRYDAVVTSEAPNDESSPRSDRLRSAEVTHP